MSLKRFADVFADAQIAFFRGDLSCCLYSGPVPIDPSCGVSCVLCLASSACTFGVDLVVTGPGCEALADGDGGLPTRTARMLVEQAGLFVCHDVRRDCLRLYRSIRAKEDAFVAPLSREHPWGRD